MKKGFDTGVNLTRYASSLAKAGYNFVGRYYNTNNPAKNLTLQEAQVLSQAGLSIIAVWENGFPIKTSYFNFNKGVQDASSAYSYALNKIQQPLFSPIYFAVDYDPSTSDINGSIKDYFKGIIEGFNGVSSNNPEYSIGVYGSGLVCASLLQANLVTYTWLAQAMGWKNSRTFKNYNIKQTGTFKECLEINGGVTGDGNNSPNDNEGSFFIL